MTKARKSPQRPPRGKAKPPELKARAVELRAAGRSLREIASELKCGETTIKRWFREEPIKAEVAAVSQDVREQAIVKLRNASTIAVDTLVDVAQRGGEVADARVKAANSILDRVGIEAGSVVRIKEDPESRLAILLGIVEGR